MRRVKILIINELVRLVQSNIDMFMTSLKVKDIINNYEVDIHEQEKNPQGYQRPPIPTHYRDIGKYLLDNSNTIFLPTALLAAIDKRQIIKESHNTLEIRGKIRIVDGQHRIKGFEYAIEKENKLGSNINNKLSQRLEDFQLPLIIMVIDLENPIEKINEVSSFININSKGKKVSTDLAINLRNEIYKLNDEYLLDENKMQEKIATETTKHLTNMNDSIWTNAIKLVPTDKGRVISLNLYNKSLFPIIKQLIEFYEINDDKEVNDMINHLQLFINDIWDIVSIVWPGCFSNKRYNKDYNIQKGIGVHALHLILTDCISTNINKLISKDNNISNLNELLSQSINCFKEVIDNSKVTEKDWYTGGRFSGYNSASGFKKVKYYILNGEFPS
jgi:DGQHR domain-containing protein